MRRFESPGVHESDHLVRNLSQDFLGQQVAVVSAVWSQELLHLNKLKKDVGFVK